MSWSSQEEKLAVASMKDAYEVFSQFNLPLWLEAGALLGYMREGKLISWDHDIDVGTLAQPLQKEGVKKRLSEAFAQRGYTTYFFDRVIHLVKDGSTLDILVNSINSNNKGEAMMWHHTSQLGLQLIKFRKLAHLEYYGKFSLSLDQGVVHMLKSNFYYVVCRIPQSLRKKIYSSLASLLGKRSGVEIYVLEVSPRHFTHVIPAVFYGESIALPHDPETYLSAIYGDWKTPPKDPTSWKWTEHGGWTKTNRK